MQCICLDVSGRRYPHKNLKKKLGEASSLQVGPVPLPELANHRSPRYPKTRHTSPSLRLEFLHCSLHRNETRRGFAVRNKIIRKKITLESLCKEWLRTLVSLLVDGDASERTRKAALTLRGPSRAARRRRR
jgi:hypothetical protein